MRKGIFIIERLLIGHSKLNPRSTMFCDSFLSTMLRDRHEALIETRPYCITQIEAKKRHPVLCVLETKY